VLTEL